MKQAAKRIASRTTIALSAVVLALPVAAFAQDTTTSVRTKAKKAKPRECPILDAKIEIVGKTNSLCFRVVEKKLTTVHVPPEAIVIRPKQSVISVDHVAAKHLIQVNVPTGTVHGTEVSAKLEGPGYTSTLFFIASARSAVTRFDYEIEHLTDEEAKRRAESEENERQAARARKTNAQLRAQVAAAERLVEETQRQLVETQTKIKQLEIALAKSQDAHDLLARELTSVKTQKANIERQLVKARAEVHDTTRAMLVEGYERTRKTLQSLVPTVSGWSSFEGSKMQVRYQTADWIGEYLVFPTNLKNGGGRPFLLANLHILNENDEVLPTFVLDPSGLENEHQGIITTIRRGSQTTVAVAVRVPPGTPTDSLRLQLTPLGQAPIAAQMPRYRMVPETEAQRRRRLWSKQLIIGPRVSYGACWLASGLDDDSLAATNCQIFSIYFIKGFHEYFAAGVEAAVGWTGDALFENEPDDFMRNAMLFRVIAYGDLRFAAGKAVPYLRLGLGAQAASYDAKLIDGGTAMEASSDLAAFFSFGGGLSYRLSEQITAGVNLSVTLPGPSLGEDADTGGALEGGLYFGYGWNL